MVYDSLEVAFLIRISPFLDDFATLRDKELHYSSDFFAGDDYVSLFLQ